MRVAFRTDGSTRIGSGHLKRCASFSQALRRIGATTSLVYRALGVDPSAVAGSAFDEVLQLPTPAGPFNPDPAIPHSAWAEVDQAADAEQSAAALQGAGTDWIVLDHYSFGRLWVERLRAALACRAVAIDDLGDRALPADIIIDHNLDENHAAKHRASLADGGRLLAGPRFALLGRSYAQAPRYQAGSDVRSVGIFMGGTDADNISAVALRACRSAGFHGPVEIATTSLNPHLAVLRDRSERDGNVRLLLDQPELAAFFARHDVQIGAGGGATWERCCIGVPSLVIQTAANQAVPLAGLVREQAALTASEVDKAALIEPIRELLNDEALRRRLSHASRALVDGRGSERAALAMTDRVNLRRARADEAEHTFPWRNHPDTRRYATDPKALDEAEHEHWWRAAVAAPDRLLLIGECGSVPVGVVRLDRDGEQAEVSIYLDPALGGLGLGRKLLDQAAALAQDQLGLRRLVATIRTENVASQRSFTAAGFAKAGHQWIRSLDA